MQEILSLIAAHINFSSYLRTRGEIRTLDPGLMSPVL